MYREYVSLACIAGMYRADTSGCHELYVPARRLRNTNRPAGGRAVNTALVPVPVPVPVLVSRGGKGGH